MKNTRSRAESSAGSFSQPVRPLRSIGDSPDGFDNEFLKFRVGNPKFAPAIMQDLARLGGTTRIDYTHYSLWLSRSRKLARAVAWNIDGGRVRSLSRRGLDFIVDARGSLPAHQNDDTLYANNPFDRGHIARRADLCWGPLSEARRANSDSFYFTNVAPQHERFNQGARGGLWGQLEDAVFNDVDVADLRVSLMGGAVLEAADPLYRGARIPRRFWKVIAYTDSADGQHKVRAFILTQGDLVDDVVIADLELQRFRWYQVPLTHIEAETGLVFPNALKALDSMAAAAATGMAAARLVSNRTLDFFAEL